MSDEHPCGLVDSSRVFDDCDRETSKDVTPQLADWDLVDGDEFPRDATTKKHCDSRNALKASCVYVVYMHGLKRELTGQELTLPEQVVNKLCHFAIENF